MKHIFIINPVAGILDKTEQIREVLSKRDDVEAIVFNTEEAGHETSIMKEMLDIFDDEPVRIYICGGSGTLSNSVDALDLEDMEHVEIGFYPCGLTNDFLKNFSEQSKKFESIDSLIDSKTRYVDYMRCVADGDENKVRNELLFVTAGVAANIERTSRLIKFLGGVNPKMMYAICTALTMPFSGSQDYEVFIDGVDYSRDYKMIYVGNSVCMGGGFVPIKMGIDCQDGFLNVLLVKKIPAFHFVRYLTEFMHGELCAKRPNDVEVVSCKEITFKRKDNKQMIINADGEIFYHNSIEIKVINGKLKFIVPNDAKFIENPEELIKCLGHC